MSVCVCELYQVSDHVSCVFAQALYIALHTHIYIYIYIYIPSSIYNVLFYNLCFIHEHFLFPNNPNNPNLALFLGKTIQASFDIGVARVTADPEAASDSQKFLLLPSPANSNSSQDDHEISIFPKLLSGSWIEVGEHLPGRLPPPPECFLFRNPVLYEVISSLQSQRRLTVVRGPPGSGITLITLITSMISLMITLVLLRFRR